MEITVRLFAHFLENLPGKDGGREAVIPLSEGTTVAHLIKGLGISAELPKVILVNGQMKEPDEELRDGDLVSIFPPVAGGSSSQNENVTVHGVSFPTIGGVF